MKKQILNLGNSLSKMEQKSINGGQYNKMAYDDGGGTGSLCQYGSQCSSGTCNKIGLRPILGTCA